MSAAENKVYPVSDSSHSKEIIIGIVLFGISTWLTMTYLNWNAYRMTHPQIYEIFIRWQYDVYGTKAMILSHNQFLQLGAIWKKLWWLLDFICEAIGRWYWLVSAMMWSLFCITAVSISLREVFGYNIFRHNRHVRIVISVSPEKDT